MRGKDRRPVVRRERTGPDEHLRDPRPERQHRHDPIDRREHVEPGRGDRDARDRRAEDRRRAPSARRRAPHRRRARADVGRARENSRRCAAISRRAPSPRGERRERQREQSGLLDSIAAAVSTATPSAHAPALGRRHAPHRRRRARRSHTSAMRPSHDEQLGGCSPRSRPPRRAAGASRTRERRPLPRTRRRRVAAAARRARRRRRRARARRRETAHAAPPAHVPQRGEQRDVQWAVEPRDVGARRRASTARPTRARATPSRAAARCRG